MHLVICIVLPYIVYQQDYLFLIFFLLDPSFIRMRKKVTHKLQKSSISSLIINKRINKCRMQKNRVLYLFDNNKLFRGCIFNFYIITFQINIYLT